MTNITHKRVRARMQLDVGNTATEYGITGFSLTYPLDDVPTATVQMAVGYDIQSAAKSPIYALADRLSEQLKAGILLEVGNEAALVFDGYTWGPGWTRTHTSAGFTLQLVHWLEDLRSTSAYSTLFTPSTTGDFVKPASYDVSGVIAMTPVAAGLHQLKLLRSDVWSACRAALLALAAKAQLTRAGADAVGGAITQSRTYGVEGNNLGGLALSRFSASPMRLAFDSEAIFLAMAANLGSVVFGNAGGLTMWSKLMTLAGLFGFAIVPLVRTARCTPLLPFVKSGLIGTTIRADEYDYISELRLTPRTLKGVALMGSYDSITRFNDSQTISHVVCGEYRLAKPGMVDIRAAPPWLNELTGKTVLALKTTGADGVGARGHAAAAGATATYMDSVNATATTAKKTGVGNAVAKNMFLNSVYRNRRVRLVGRLRMDIAPGANVAIALPGDKAAEYGTKMLYGLVEKVTIEVDATKAMAATSFDISFVRTVKDDEITESVHPLYGDVYAGDRLS